MIVSLNSIELVKEFQQTFLKIFKTPEFKDSIEEELGKAMTEQMQRHLQEEKNQ